MKFWEKTECLNDFGLGKIFLKEVMESTKREIESPNMRNWTLSIVRTFVLQKIALKSEKESHGMGEDTEIHIYD